MYVCAQVTNFRFDSYIMFLSKEVEEIANASQLCAVI